ncbi:hypothetical protein MBM_05867 [Drepanopeziza brunnea f. sp. 'multigermtubi' MB_m1]|uniref:Uncharacterized protein n=1 Tax=Marssonina brunnea f. sp. multigermtubi (strain MB_m1) TaxID=1072389 RepID=K1WS29_MARBU|nr:uncharacterized protein MBM_05867 [Drepanopeziza brunnea f. sp. 'multigermtubi' MB_m1]EKD15856.1 hypothetical protein MBM_05867 [Drepanopeziza brunnea f. sp. 'multigermtubi' MB_m1]
MPLSKCLCTILLAFSFLFNRAHGLFLRREIRRQIIGYRTVSAQEADYINQNNTPLRFKGFDQARQFENQLGSGLSLTQKPALWPGSPSVENWHCVVEADSDMFANARKVYIPGYYQKKIRPGKLEEVALWHGGEVAIEDYIKLSVQRHPGRALRFSYIENMGWELQMVIPTDAVNGNDLALWSKCFETKEELLKYSSETIDWQKWHITGDLGSPSLETFVPWINDA